MNFFVNLLKKICKYLTILIFLFYSTSIFSESSLREELRSAIYFGNVSLVSKLIGKGVNINENDSYGRSPLIQAILMNNVNMVKLIVDNGAELNNSYYFSKTPLIEAICIGNSEIVEYLIKKGALVHLVDKSNKSPIEYAAEYGRVDIAELLVNSNINAINSSRSIRSSLILAVAKGHGSIVDLLIKRFFINKKFLENIKFSDGKNLLFAAIDCGKKEIVSSLISAGADLENIDINGWSPLKAAIYLNNKDIIKMLLENGVNANGNDNNKVPSPLICALIYFDKRYVKDVVSLLIKHGANVNGNKNYKVKPLYLSIVNDLIDVAKLLISSGADLNAYSFDNSTTALHNATIFNKLEFVNLLINSGADVNIKDNRGFTPLDYAEGEVFNILTLHGACTGEELISWWDRFILTINEFISNLKKAIINIVNCKNH
ncbi:ankyrin repeat domain-containing protein [Candidatus Dependentiae bacterium]|nr:ankyrin repeat domain-containing protein [Candidatus Dependentiae bacterium]MBU4387013.1 ankyrin repeat domain-containing protein [Candidatus Dependentiae bacterium]MCG2756094.1 ankyrin repeat domain-containing protein [Candidatus Dependentiae bacterium]